MTSNFIDGMSHASHDPWRQPLEKKWGAKKGLQSKALFRTGDVCPYLRKTCLLKGFLLLVEGLVSSIKRTVFVWEVF